MINKLAKFENFRFVRPEPIPKKNVNPAIAVNENISAKSKNLFDSSSVLKYQLQNSSNNSKVNYVNTQPLNSIQTENTQPVSLNKEEQAQLAYDYAPIFYLHPNEDYEPGDPMLAIEGEDSETFSDNAKVNGQYVTVHGTPGKDENGNPVVFDTNGEIMVDENGKPVIHATQIPPESYMEIQEKNHGEADSAPIIYQYSEGPPPSMTYWVFSPYNNGYNDHQGDWEGVTIEFSTNSDGTLGEPTSVTYSSHSSPVTVPWDLAPKEEERLMVFVGEGSHAMSPNTENRSTEVSILKDHFGKGERIDSREDKEGKTRLRNIYKEPWYGMEAHWGKKGNFDGLTNGVNGPSPNGKNRINDKRTDSEKEADEYIANHAERDENGNVVFDENGKPVINYESLAIEAAELARTDPEGSAELIIAISNRAQTINGEGDEFAQEFIDALCPDDTEVENSELAVFAQTESGRDVLRSLREDLSEGKVHSDELNDIAKINFLIGID